MLKSLAIGFLTLTAACSTAAFADDGDSIPPYPQWTAGESIQQYWESIEAWLQEAISEWEEDHGGNGGDAVAAPEIDPAGAMAALALLGGGLAVIRGRRSQTKRS